MALGSRLKQCKKINLAAQRSLIIFEKFPNTLNVYVRAKLYANMLQEYKVY